MVDAFCWAIICHTKLFMFTCMPLSQNSFSKIFQFFSFQAPDQTARPLAISQVYIYWATSHSTKSQWLGTLFTDPCTGKIFPLHCLSRLYLNVFVMQPWSILSCTHIQNRPTQKSSLSFPSPSVGHTGPPYGHRNKPGKGAVSAVVNDMLVWATCSCNLPCPLSFSGSILDVIFHIKVDYCWTYTALWFNISSRTKLVMCSSRPMVTLCPMVKHSASTSPSNSPRAFSQKTYNSMLQMA